MTALPFHVFEAELALSTVDGNGDPLAEVWLGACPEQLTLEDRFIEHPLETHGRDRKQIYHEDEAHAISLGNVNAVQINPDSVLAVRLRRNVEYVLVIVWFDEDRSGWRKRSYFGVKASSTGSAEDSIRNTLRLTAEDLTEIAGLGDKPDLLPVRSGEVIYVDGATRHSLYAYDPGTRSFTEQPDFDATLAAIDASTPGELHIRIGTDPYGAERALAATAEGVTVRSLVATGGTFLDDSPRLEFWAGSSRVASLSRAALAVPDLFEQASPPPVNSGTLAAYNAGWLFSFRSGGYAPQWTEGTP